MAGQVVLGPLTAPSAQPAAEEAGAARAPHLTALDGVRGLAISLVLITHAATAGLRARTAPERVWESVAHWGWAGVDLFFVLSGFLITGILLATRRKAHYLRNFFARRVLRILPLYYATLFVCFVLLPAVPWSEFDWLRALSPEQWWFWLHLSNYYRILVRGPDLGWLSTLWSLAVEEHFYLVWPFVVWKLSERRLLQVCLAGAAAAFGARVLFLWLGFSADDVYRGTLTRFDPLLLGAALAVLWRRPSGLGRLRRVALPGLAGTLAAIALLISVKYAGGFEIRGVVLAGKYTLVGALCAGLLVLVLADAKDGPVGRLFRCPPLVVLGKYSYAVYIFNKPVFAGLLLAFRPWAHPVFGSQLPALAAFTAAGSALTLGCALVSWHLLERPFLSLKRYFE
jgi:peptidoglycan/LPS O-acetylase OafA/YrhL